MSAIVRGFNNAVSVAQEFCTGSAEPVKIICKDGCTRFRVGEEGMDEVHVVSLSGNSRGNWAVLQGSEKAVARYILEGGQ